MLAPLLPVLVSVCGNFFWLRNFYRAHQPYDSSTVQKPRTGPKSSEVSHKMAERGAPLLGRGGAGSGRNSGGNSIKVVSSAFLLLAVCALAVVLTGQQHPATVLETVDAIERTALNNIDPKELQETPPDRWADPDPWVLDSDDFATDFKASPGQLSEFFSESPRRFAHTDTWDGASWEWPYVPDGQDARGMRSGYDWEGAGSSVSARGLDMPPDHDVFGELGPFPALSGSDELFPGVRSWDTVMPAGSLPGTQTMGISLEQPQAARPLQSLAQRRGTKVASAPQQHLRLQSLQNIWTDYTQSGDGVKCVCDSAAAGDPEMEGIDPNVKPACTCTGGRTTQFTKTEEGGPLDTGGHGAWPQELPGASRDKPGDGAAYIDGIVGNNAYKAPTQSLAAGREEMATHEEGLKAWNTLLGIAEKAVGGSNTQLSRRLALDEVKADTAEGDDARTGDDANEAEYPRWRTLHEDPKATAADRNLIEQLRRNYRAFLKESEYCDQLGDYCDGR